MHKLESDFISQKKKQGECNFLFRVVPDTYDMYEVCVCVCVSVSVCDTHCVCDVPSSGRH